MKLKEVFISYKSEEFNDADFVRKSLEDAGISCWMAPNSITGGSSYAQEIPQAIRNCKVFVLILSENAQKSKWVPRELDQAINDGKTILPFMIENCALKDDFSFYLTNVQRYAAYENKERALNKMISEIKSILGIKTEIAKEVVQNVSVDIASDNAKNELIENDASYIKVQQKPSTQKKVTKNKQSTKKLPVIAAIVVGLVFVSCLISSLNKVEICGQKFKKNDDFITISGQELNSEDVEKILSMKKLSSLHLSECNVPDGSVKQFANKIGVSLILSDCGLSDEDLKGVDFSSSSLYSLDLSLNPDLEDLSSLSSLSTSLANLKINGCNVSDVSFLKGFELLRTFYASGNNISDISALSGCTSLATLDLSDNQLTNIKALSKLSGIDEIYISNNKISSLEGLENSINLRKICASNNNLKDIKNISNSTRLTTVDFSNNFIYDASVISKSYNDLKDVNLSSNKIKNLSFLSKCTNVTKLYFDNNKVESIDFVSGLSDLTVLSASNNNINKIAALEKCLKLDNVDLSDNDISDISPLKLASSSKRCFLDLSNNKITKLVLPKGDYSKLILFGNPITNFDDLLNVSGSVIVFDYSDKISKDVLIELDFASAFIFDVPLDKQVDFTEYTKKARVTFTNEEEYVKNFN
jgi:Leucine-rich repeat (LRR) protein